MAVALGGALSASAAAGPPRTAVIGMGDCRDAELIDSARALSRNLAQERGMSVVSETELLDRIGRKPSKTLEELRSQLDIAQEQFYQARYARAIKQLEGALQEIARLPPGSKRWQLEASSRLLEGLIRTRLQGDASVVEPFTRVLRLDPNYKLDPDYFGPSTIERFDKVRRQLAGGRRSKLDITSHPTGAEVFLDGRPVGKTPYHGSLAEGSYQLLVGRDGALSLPREVRVPGSGAIHVDLQFEGTVHRHRTVCLAEAKDEQARLANAVKLASILDLDHLVLLRIDRPGQGANWMAATLLKVAEGRKIREGGLQFEEEGVSDSGIAELARFVATGEQMPRIILPSTSEQPSGAIAASIDRGRPDPATSLSAAGTSMNAGSAPGWLSPFLRRPFPFALGAVGAGAIATGVTFLALSRVPLDRYNALKAEGLYGDKVSRARDLLNQFTLRRNLGFVGLGLGAGALAGGTILYLLHRQDPEPPRAPTLLAGATSNGFAVALDGEF
ncbi:MAG TPA: PEGA domain-containing protein [Myxococcaceae bacterium]|nr:PEGA domain-containing protein [Myxococcaceae bacterium]